LDSQATNGDKPITILMNNPGGDVYHGMAIFDAIQNCKNHVTVKAYGYVMSMGSIIIQAADYRTMSKNSKMMIHYGENGFHGHAKIAQKIVEDIKEFDRKMEDMFLEKMTGRKITIEEYLTLVDKKDEIPKGNAKNKLIEIDRERLREMLNFDTFLTPKMALKLNLIDAILER
jgi:ATP-dependent protease ClpP protease subunit